MKMLKITLAAFALLLTGFAGKADANNLANDKLSMKYAASTYLDAFVHGKIDGFAEILDDHAKYTSPRGNLIISYNRDEILEMVNQTKGIEQDCKASYSVMESLPTQVILKVKMKYTNFTKVNYVTMAQTNKGWRITNISTVYQ